MIESSQFEKLSKKDKIKEVANDVVRMLDMRTILVENCVFLKFKDENWRAHGNPESETLEEQTRSNLWPKMPKLMEDCHCCAVGACLLSLGRFSGQFAPVMAWGGDNGAVDSEWSVRKVSDIFGVRMTQLIEVAFEVGAGYWPTPKEDGSENDLGLLEVDADGSYKCILDWGDFNAAMIFGDRYDNPRERMVAIMQHILAHDGTFEPLEVMTPAEKERLFTLAFGNKDKMATANLDTKDGIATQDLA